LWAKVRIAKWRQCGRLYGFDGLYNVHNLKCRKHLMKANDIHAAEEIALGMHKDRLKSRISNVGLWRNIWCGLFTDRN
jgi:hypothetical protein